MEHVIVYNLLANVKSEYAEILNVRFLRAVA